jgi:hypothetical protein
LSGSLRSETVPIPFLNDWLIVEAKAAASQEIWTGGADCVNRHAGAAEALRVSPFLTAFSANGLNGRSIN